MTAKGKLVVNPEGPQAAEPIDVGAAQAAIEANRRQRAEFAAREIQAVLEKHKCQIVAVPQVSQDGRIVAIVQIVAQ